MAVTDHFDATFQVNGTKITVNIHTDDSLGTEALNTASAKYSPCGRSIATPTDQYDTAEVVTDQALVLSEYCYNNVFRFHVTLTDNNGNYYEATTPGYNSGELNSKTFTLEIDVGHEGTYDAWVSLEVLLYKSSEVQPV